MFIVFELILLVLKITYYYLEAFFRAVVPPRRKDIKGQNVLITGGGGGIGKALAIKFSQYGAKIALWDLNAVCKNKGTFLSRNGEVSHI